MYLEFASIRASSGVAAVIGGRQAEREIEDAVPNNNNSNSNKCNHSYNYNLAQQQQQQQQQPSTHEPSLNVEAVILQNQVDTLHWQLKQTETNCEMYRAVMEEVARFFERYQQQQQQQQSRQQQLQLNRHSLGGVGVGVGEQISRSKSLHHVLNEPNGYTENPTGIALSSSSSSSSSCLRARSSTNLMLNKSMLTMNENMNGNGNEDHNYEMIAPAGSYSAFKDFTWRRSPKKFGGCKSRLSSPEAAEEKLNQEAFRLARTIRNLLHMSQQQPDLTQPRNSMAAGGGGQHHHHNLHHNYRLKTSSVLTLHNCNDAMDASLNLTLPTVKSSNNNNSNNNNNNNTTATPTSVNSVNSTAEMLFLRANTMRDSRLSLRSSTDSSVHSTISSSTSASTSTSTSTSSSSKTETDEEITAITTGNNSSSNSNKSTGNNNNNNNNGSSTEDESGFSSISSFHDVGLPLSSTLIGDNNNNNSNNNNNHRLSLSAESRNSTLKSTLNVVGVPLPQLQMTANQSLSCQSLSLSPSQSPAKTYRNANRYQSRFSTLSNEDAAAVLWV
ncbi:hypothetical protein ACLKA7_017601 [Drosophila subpalustris]